MNKKISYVFLIFLISIFALNSFAADKKIYKSVSNKDQLTKNSHRPLAEGKRKTYVFTSQERSLNFLIPRGLTTCDKVWDKFLESIDFPALKKIGEENHINYSFAQTDAVNASDGSHAGCVETKDGHLIVVLSGVLEGLDEVGNTQIESYLATIKGRNFFGYPVEFVKPERIVRSYTLTAWRDGRGPDEEEEYGHLQFYVTSEALDFTEQQFAKFGEAFKKDSNKSAVIDFFNTYFNDVPRVTRAIEKIMDWKVASAISLETNTTYLMAFNYYFVVTASDIGNFHEDVSFNCLSVGNCFR
jgi:hypothetical protein